MATGNIPFSMRLLYVMIQDNIRNGITGWTYEDVMLSNNSTYGARSDTSSWYIENVQTVVNSVQKLREYGLVVTIDSSGPGKPSKFTLVTLTTLNSEPEIIDAELIEIDEDCVPAPRNPAEFELEKLNSYKTGYRDGFKDAHSK